MESLDGVSAAPVDLSEETDLRAGSLLPSLSLSSLSDDCACLWSLPGLARSNADPGVLGVLLALPNEAKAPLPRPKAEDAPGAAVVGDATEAVEMFPRALNGLRLPWLLVAPKRLEEALSWWSRLLERSDLLVDRLSLLLLLVAWTVSHGRRGI